jgi:hypothetical protein
MKMCQAKSEEPNSRSRKRIGCLLDAEQLDIEDQKTAGASTARVIIITELRRNPEATLFADFHELKAFGPSFDDVIEC